MTDCPGGRVQRLRIKLYPIRLLDVKFIIKGTFPLSRKLFYPPLICEALQFVSEIQSTRNFIDFTKEGSGNSVSFHEGFCIVLY